MKQLILLAGLHKTGTTSIQKTCHNNHERLSALGFVYPVEKTTLPNGGVNVNPNHSRLLGEMFKSGMRSVNGKNAAFQESLAPNNEKEKSQKKFEHFINEQKNTRLLLIAESVSLLTDEELLDLKNWFTQRNFTIRIFCCIRKPSSWLDSMVAQRVIGKHGPKITLTAALNEFIGLNGLIVPRAKRLLRVFPDTQFYSFESALQHASGPAGYFLDRIGVNKPEQFLTVKANKGLSDHAVRLNSLINEIIGHRFKSNESHEFHTSPPAKLALTYSIPGEKFYLRHDEVAPLLPILNQENAWLKNTFGDGFYDEEISFSSNPIVLDEETRKFLIKNFSSAGPRIRQIVDHYLAEHRESAG